MTSIESDYYIANTAVSLPFNDIDDNYATIAHVDSVGNILDYVSFDSTIVYELVEIDAKLNAICGKACALNSNDDLEYAVFRLITLDESLLVLGDTILDGYFSYSYVDFLNSHWIDEDKIMVLMSHGDTLQSTNDLLIMSRFD